MILDGKAVRKEILDKLKQEVSDNNFDITLAIVYVGDDEPSKLYIHNKMKYSKYIGIKTKLIEMDNNTKEEEVIKVIKELNSDDSVTGIILQSPVPKGIDIENCIKYIDPKKDVDGFSKENFFKLAHNVNGLRPSTSKGIIDLLKFYNIDLSGKRVCLIGRGNLVGKPLLFELINNDATVTVCHTKTKNLKAITLASDIIICAAGSPKLLTVDMVSSDAIVVDVGITIIDGKIVGDIDYEALVNKCKYVTPNPGGVGPMTIATLLANTVEAKKLYRKDI